MNDELLNKLVRVAEGTANYDRDYDYDLYVTNWPEVVKAIVEAAHPNTTQEDLSIVLNMAADLARKGTDKSIREFIALRHMHDDIRGIWHPPGIHLN